MISEKRISELARELDVVSPGKIVWLESADELEGYLAAARRVGMLVAYPVDLWGTMPERCIL